MEPLLSIRFSPDDPLIDIYRKRRGVVDVIIQIDPRLAVGDSSFVVLADGIVHQDPFEAGTNPFLQERWNLFIDLDKKELWTGFGQPPLPIKTGDLWKLLGLMLVHSPGEVTPSQIQESLGNFDLNAPAIRKKVSRLRAIIGPDMILPGSRGLNPDKVIIIKEKPAWKPTTTSK